MSSGKTTIVITGALVVHIEKITGNEAGVEYTIKYNTPSKGYNTYEFTVPTTYEGTNTSNLFFVDEFSNTQKSPYPKISPVSWWSTTDNKKYNLIVSGAITISAGKGSLNITINDSNNKPLETFRAIPADLDTSILANGDYADVAIPIIFEKLKNFVYPESIFSNIQCVLSSFFVSIALQQRISERIQTSVQKIIAGEINLEQFKELVQQGNEEFANEYGDNYVSNFVKLQIAIDKHKHMLQN